MRTNFAPTARTIIVALVLIVVGLLGTYGSVLPDRPASSPSWPRPRSS